MQAGSHGLHGEVNELKELVKNLAGRITQLTEKDSSDQQTGHPGTPRNNDHLLTMLIDRGINAETSRTITGLLRQSLPEQELCDSVHLNNAILATIQDLIKVGRPIFTERNKQRRIALVGPTGVGKTTTLAKIAANYLSRYSPSIALITIDTYRIAAVEQLKVYGEIMRLPVDVVITPEQLKQALVKHSDKELILIDTAGRSPRDSYCIDELASFLPAELDIDKHLVLSAGSRENELLSTIERFNALGISNTIFTKVDECATLGILLNVQIQNSNPLSYVTNGQRVPEDLLEVSPKIVAQLIMAQHEGSLHD
jgi:flagellar biosynthesis protein FlhF